MSRDYKTFIQSILKICKAFLKNLHVPLKVRKHVTFL